MRRSASFVLTSTCILVVSHAATLLSAETYRFKTIQPFQPNGMNQFGVLVGQTGIPVGGIYRSANFLTSISDPLYPQAEIRFFMRSMARATSVGSSDVRGFVLKNGVFTTVFPNSTSTYAAGLNDSDEVVGFYADSQFVSHGFVWSNESYTSIDYPQTTFTRAQAIDNSGRVAGFALLSLRAGGIHRNGSLG